MELKKDLKSKVNTSQKLLNEGVVVINNFLSNDTVKKIKQEIDIISSSSKSLSRLGVIIKNKSLNRESFDIPDAANVIRSTNLLEYAIQIKDLIRKSFDNSEKNIDLKLTMLSISLDSEPNEISLHSDNLNFSKIGMFRGIIYLSDSDKNSGAFRYLKGSHYNDHKVTHYISNKNKTFKSNQIKECEAKSGSLVLFNAYGIHGRNSCKKSRLSISFEFLPSKLAKRNNSVSIIQGHLTDKVISNINLFTILLKDDNNNLIIDDQLKEKFWCPTTAYDFNNRKYVKGISYHLKAIFYTLINMYFPIKTKIKLRQIIKKLRSKI